VHGQRGVLQGRVLQRRVLKADDTILIHSTCFAFADPIRVSLLQSSCLSLSTFRRTLWRESINTNDDFTSVHHWMLCHVSYLDKCAYIARPSLDHSHVSAHFTHHARTGKSNGLRQVIWHRNTVRQSIILCSIYEYMVIHCTRRVYVHSAMELSDIWRRENDEMRREQLDSVASAGYLGDRYRGNRHSYSVTLVITSRYRPADRNRTVIDRK